MRLVITSTENKGDKTPAANRGGGQRARSCGCGQQLDICARAHCPRCGRTLRRS